MIGLDKTVLKKFAYLVVQNYPTGKSNIQAQVAIRYNKGAANNFDQIFHHLVKNVETCLKLVLISFPGFTFLMLVKVLVTWLLTAGPDIQFSRALKIQDISAQRSHCNSTP